MENEKQIEYLSLYDFLGKPAGSELGKKVYSHASKCGVKVMNREITSPKYKGTILTYPSDFLTDYFSSSPKEDDFMDLDIIPNLGDIQDYDLPF
jgi:hypothetical protein